MNTLQPGQFVKNFTSKTGKQGVIRYPTWKDFGQALQFANALSQEDTFLPMSGEAITSEEQEKKFRMQFRNMATGNGVTLFCFIDQNLVGTAGIFRNTESRKKSYHVGIFGISVVQAFRGEGIGYALTTASLEEAKKNMPGLRLITLKVQEPNISAIELYKKVGFVETGRIPKGIFHKNEYIDQIIMCKEV